MESSPAETNLDKVPNIEDFIKSRNLDEGKSPENLKRTTYIILGIILFIVVGFGIYLTISILTFSNKKSGNGPKPGISVDKYENAFFIPRKAEENKFYSGKIEYAPEVTDAPLIKHKLVNKDGDTLFYLFSSQNDLNLSVGIDVEIDGKLSKNKYNDISVLEVNTIKLK